MKKEDDEGGAADTSLEVSFDEPSKPVKKRPALSSQKRVRQTVLIDVLKWSAPVIQGICYNSNLALFPVSTTSFLRRTRRFFFQCTEKMLAVETGNEATLNSEELYNYYYMYFT